MPSRPPKLACRKDIDGLRAVTVVHLNAGHSTSPEGGSDLCEADFGPRHAIFSTIATERYDVSRISLVEEPSRTGIRQGTLDGKPLFSDGNHSRFGVSGYCAYRLSDAFSFSDGGLR